MTQVSHTPGPWTMSTPEHHSEPVLINATEWEALAVVHGNVDPFASLEGRANARLIAAAPDLLEALLAARGVLQCILGTDIENRICAEQIALIDAAIEKARGQS